MKRIIALIILFTLGCATTVFAQKTGLGGLSHSTLTLIILLIMAICFVTEILPLAVTAMSGAITLGVLGIITPNIVFSGLSNSTVVLFAGMFVVGAAMFHTGLAQFLGSVVVRGFGTGEKSLMFGTMLIAALLSAISSNTATTAALMPMIIGVCAVAKISPSRQLMPLAFAAGFGGTMTLVGTPPNIIANNALNAANLKAFGFFEFAKIGIPLTVVGMIYMMLLSKYLLPNVPVDESLPVEKASEEGPKDKKKMIITGIVLIVVVIVMALDLKKFPLQMAAVSAAIILVVTDCVNEKDAYRGIDWQTIFLFAGMMPVATALDKSGAGKMIADTVISMMGGSPSPYILCAVLYILSAVLTQFMSNTASAALLCPIGISIASGIGVNPQGVIMTIAVAASCAFATPIGTPPNTLVLSAGKYRFMNYVKMGTPLIFIYLIVTMLVVPIMWPFKS